MAQYMPSLPKTAVPLALLALCLIFIQFVVVRREQRGLGKDSSTDLVAQAPSESCRSHEAGQRGDPELCGEF